MWLNAALSTQADKTHPIEELVVERHAHTRCMADPPRPFRTEGRGMGQLRSDPALDQFRLSSAIHLPLFPLEASQTMANPAVQVPQH